MIISILIPAYNEEKTILEVLKSVNEQIIEGVELDIVVVNDGSSDKTHQILEENKDLYQNYVHLQINQGKGAAVIAGLKECKGEYILFQDADLEYSPDEYSRIFEPVIKFQPDIVYGSRFLAPKVTRVAYFWNKQGNKAITTLFNLLHNTTFTDIYSCYFLYKKSLVDPSQLKCFSWDQQAEILSHAVKAGKEFYEVPISYFGRTIEEGKKIKALDILPVFKTIILQKFLK